MHVTIEAKPRGGLQIIHDLPIYRLGRLEGYNGIGKSAAIRLLRVCFGDQPYLPQEQNLWASFRDYVGECVVRMTGLSGGSMLEWHLDSRVWPKTSSEPLVQVGTILFDGAEVDLAAVRKLVRVERIVGNEGLVPTLVRQLQPRRAAIEAAFGDGSAVQTRLTEVDGMLLSVQTHLEPVVGADLVKLAEETRRTVAKQAHAERRRNEARQRADQLEEVQELVRRLADVRGRSGDLDQQARDLADEMERADRRLKELDKEVADAGKRSGAQPAAVKELQLAQRNAGRTEARLQEALLECRGAAGAIGLEGDPLQIDVPAEVIKAQGELDRLNSELRSVFAAPRVADVAERLVTILGEAEASGLSNEVIDFGDENRATVTVAALRDRLQRNARRLRDAKPSEDAARMQTATDTWARRLRLLSSLENVQREVVRRIGLSENAAERLAVASRAVSALSGHQFGELVTERERLTEHLRSLAVERADVVRARAELGGGLPESELARRLQERLIAAGSDLETLERDAQATHADAAALEQEFAVAAARSLEVEQAEKQAREQITAALDRLRTDETLAWARETVRDLNVQPGSLEQAQQMLRPVLDAVHRARQRRDRAASQPLQVSNILKVLEEQLPKQSSAVPATGEDPANLVAVRGWFGEEVSKWFRQPQILNTLFNGASTVHVNLSDMTVNWSIENEPYTRPLTAFSSGEQAFAYTRAQLEILDIERQAHNQIIALDEFGAFISRNWLYRLESYLKERVTAHPTDRLLLILPLTRTEDELRQSGVDADKLSKAENDGYFVTRLFDDD